MQKTNTGRERRESYAKGAKKNAKNETRKFMVEMLAKCYLVLFSFLVFFSRNFRVFRVRKFGIWISSRQSQLVQRSLHRASWQPIFPRHIDGIVFQQTIVWQTFNRRELAMGTVVGAFVAADMVADCA